MVTSKERKMKNVANLKNVYTEQLNKLQHKHQHECELLEDMKLFTKQRSVIEKEYAQALSKLAQQFITKRPPVPPPSLSAQDSNKEQKTMHEVWQTLLEETDKVGKTRLQASEIYSQQISESCKVVRGLKVHVAKKVFENLVEMQKDLSNSIQELVKLQKVYKDEEHLAHDARVKATEAEEKVKKKSVGIFTSFSKLQQQSAKLKARMETCESKSTAARNEYLLSLASINAHLNRYYNKDAPELIKAMDGEIYEKMQEYLTAFCQAELQSCGTTQECFMRILADSTKVNRDFQLRGFLVDNPIFTDLIQYQFQPQDNDLVGKVSISFQNSSLMEAEARKCASKMVQADREARVLSRKLTKLHNNVSQEQSNDSHTDPQVKEEEMRQLIRKSEVEKVKMEARLEAIRQAGINTQAFINSAKTESETPEEEEEPTVASAPSVEPSYKSDDSSPIKRASFKSSSPSNKRTSYNNDNVIAASFNNNIAEEAATNGWDQPDQQQFNNNTATSTTAQMDRQESFKEEVVPTEAPVEDEPGQASLALYSFQGTGENELDLREGEVLDTLGEVQDGWIRARDQTGKVGLVPAAYVQIGSTVPPQEMQQNNVETFDDPWNEASATVPADVGFTDNFATQEPFPPIKTTSIDDPYTNTDMEIQDALTTPLPVPTSDKVWARALYDYYATNNEELTFNEGQLIQVLRKELHDGVDDGWWEGEINGKVGVFPSLVVQEESAEGNGVVADEDDDEEDGILVEADHDQPGPPQFDAPMPENIQNGHLSEDVQEVLKEAEPPKEAPKNEPIQNGFETKVDDVEVSKEEIKTKEEEKKEDKKKEEEEKEDRPPTPPAPLEHAPQLEITIPTPTEGGKTTSELLQAHTLACSG